MPCSVQAATYRSVSGSPAVVVEPMVHLVVDGQSFATVLQHCPELLPRVSGWGHLEVGPSGGGVLTLVPCAAAGEGDSVCADVSSAEAAVGGTTAGHRVSQRPLLISWGGGVTVLRLLYRYNVAMCGDGANDCGVSGSYRSCSCLVGQTGIVAALC